MSKSSNLLPKCRLETYVMYLNQKTGEYVHYVCPESEEDVLENGLCIFHDKRYLRESIFNLDETLETWMGVIFLIYSH